MKKFIITLLAALAVSLPAFAFEADVAQFGVWLNNVKIEHKATEYPLLVYKDITYFPMTYDYVHMLGLTSSWTDGCFYLSYCPPAYDWRASGATPAPEVTKIEGEIADYPIYINGKPIDNSKEEYPVFNARGITYFPMTWRFATQEFGIDYIWNGNLILNSGGNGGAGSFFIEEGGKLYFDNDIYIFHADDKYEGQAGFSLVGEKKYVFDPLTRSVEETGDFPKYRDKGTQINEKLSINGNSLMYAGAPIADISDYVAAEKNRENPLGINVYGYEYELGGGLTLVYISMNYKTQFAQPHLIGHRTQWFVRDALGLKSFDPGFDFTFEKAETTGGKRYLCLNVLESTPNTSYSTDKYVTYVMSDDAGLTPVTDADHTNVRLLGVSGDKAVVLAAWKEGSDGVSAVNDGYFIVRPDGGLDRIYPYVFGDDIAVVDGHLYLLIFRNSVILDVTTGEEIKF